MEIKVLGTGCTKYKNLEELTIYAVKKLGIEATVAKEEDIVNIMNYGVMRTPSLAINGEVVLSGRLPSENELSELITSNRKISINKLSLLQSNLLFRFVTGVSFTALCY